MQANDKPEFFAVLSRTFKTLGKGAPEPEVIDVWWTKLEPFPLEAVAHAFSRHLDVSEFAPTPAAILRHLPKLGDGHLEAAEAWAIARNARDEAETVCWTQEMAEALSVTNGIGNDEYAARTAFTARYNRLVEDARANGARAVWFMSYGHDASKREGVALEAVRTGRLQLEHVRAALPMLAAPAVPDTQKAQEQRAELDRLLESIPNHAERLEQKQAEIAAQQREFTAEAKRNSAQRVADYEARP
jgi:hypothetical protein